MVDLLHRRRHRVALLVAVAAHVERNTPQVFPQATTDRLEDAADELLSGGDLSFETRTVVVRMLQSVIATQTTRAWSAALRDDLAEYVDELGAP